MSNSKLRHWTPEKDSILVNDYLAYVPVDEIAAKLNRSEGLLRQRTFHLGLRRSKHVSRVLKRAPEHLKKRLHEMDPDEWRAAYRAWRDGEKQKARAENKARARAKRMARAADIYRRNDMPRSLQMRAMHAIGLTYEEIGAHYNVSRMRVHMIVTRMMLAAEIDRSSDAPRKEKMKAMRRDGLGYKDIAEYYGIRSGHVRRIVNLS